MNGTTQTPDAQQVSRRDAQDAFVEQVRNQLQEILSDDPGLRQSHVADQAGISGSALSTWLIGTYQGNSVNVATKIQRWINSRVERKTLQSLTPDAPRFFESATARAITTVFEYAQALEDIVMVAGVPGIGKSTSCDEYRREHPNVWIATMAPQRSAVVPVLREICSAVGGSPAQSADALAREAARKIRGRQGLLIVDEAHHVSAAGLDAIRSLHDETQVGIALVGGPELIARVERMPQLHSRVGLRITRAAVVREDVESLLDAWQIEDPIARRELARIAERPGALRSATKALRLATNIARGAGSSMGLQHIRQAARTLSARAGGEDA